MGKLRKRLAKRFAITKEKWDSDCRFSRKYAMLRILDDYSNRLRLRRISARYHQKKEAWCLNYLRTVLQPVFAQFSQETSAGRKAPVQPIWVCWWTGLETAPPLVRQCIKSIQKNAGTHPVHLITQENYSEFVSVPEFLLERLNRKEIGLAHFADYLRVCLLNQYGGLWLDATIFCAKELPQEYFDMSFFTCKSPYRESRYLSNYQWVTFCLGGFPGNLVFRFLQAAFEQYWKQHTTAIDYLFFDDLIFLGCEQLPAFRKALEAVPINNLHRDDLQAAMNQALPAEDFQAQLQEDTVLYKLSWRETYQTETADGRPTVFAQLLEMR